MTSPTRSDRYARLHERVSATLYETDPDEIGSSIDAPLDEYDDIATRLIPRLLAANSTGELREQLAEIFFVRVDELLQPIWEAISDYRSADARQ